MTRALALAALLSLALAVSFSARYVHAQTIGAAGGDTLELAPHPLYAATLTYTNSGGLVSRNATLDLCIEAHGAPLCVVARVEVLGGQPQERLTVTAPDGFLAVPPEADVNDGDALTVLIVQPMF